ncbi:MAG: SRPBCC family protein [Kordiimonadaceae bacterium]|nr:SRPBCC family protein [Kordiimonadaceae bacterium]
MIRIFTSTIINASVQDVWAAIRDFNELPNWHPMIKSSEIVEGLPSDKIGCVRTLTLEKGPQVQEQLVSMSDQDHSFSYTMLDAPLGMYNYISTVKLRPVTDGNACFMEWTAEFTTKEGEEDEKRDMVANGVFKGGFSGLKALLKK